MGIYALDSWRIFCAGEDELNLLVSVVVVIVVGDVVLHEMAELPELLTIIGGFGRQYPVLPFLWFLQIIVNAQLAGGCPEQ